MNSPVCCWLTLLLAILPYFFFPWFNLTQNWQFYFASKLCALITVCLICLHFEELSWFKELQSKRKWQTTKILEDKEGNNDKEQWTLAIPTFIVQLLWSPLHLMSPYQYRTWGRAGTFSSAPELTFSTSAAVTFRLGEHPDHRWIEGRKNSYFEFSDIGLTWLHLTWHRGETHTQVA